MPRHSPVAVMLISCTLIAILVFLLSSLTLPGLGGNDFVSFYKAGAAARTGRLAEVLAEQNRSASLHMPIIRPPVYSFLLAPLTLLPFSLAMWLWVSAHTALYLACSAWAIRRFGEGVAVLAMMFPPALYGISHGQDCVLMLATLAGAYILAGRRREYLGGLVLGIGLFKFHLLLAWPFALAVQKRWRLLAGFCTAAAGIFLLSVLLVGWGGVREYAALLAGNRLEHATPHVTRHISLDGFLANVGIGAVWVRVLISVLVLAMTLDAVRRDGLERLFQVVPLGSLVLAPHCLYYDPTLLLLPIWIAVSSPAPRLVRWTALAVASPMVLSAVGLSPPWRIIASSGLLVLFALTAGYGARWIRTRLLGWSPASR